MPKVVTLSDHKAFYRIRASPKYSAALLNISFERDVIRLCFELLRDICHEHARLLRRDSNNRSTSSCNRDPSEAHTHARPTNTDVGAAYSGADPKHLIVARLNVLVLISKRVFLRLDEQHDLLQPVLGAIYRVIRLVIWSHNRAVRCASLRCLRYYVRTAADIRLLLQLRMDLLIARCLDLSYLPDEHNDRQPVISPFSHQDAHRSAGFRSARFRIPHPSSHNSSKPLVGSDSTQAFTLINSSFARRATRIHPRMRKLDRSDSKSVRPVSPSSSDPRHSLDVIDDTVSAAPSPPGCLTSSSLVSGVGERQLFLRLAYHLVRVAPHLLPYSIIQALAAPCLRAGRFQAAGGGSIGPLGRPPDALHRFPAPEAARPVALGMLPRHLATGCDQIRIPSENENNPITSDVALRTCLLILAELVILAPEHVAMISDIKATAVSPPLECESRNSTQLDDPSTLKRKDSVIVQALMSAFASCSAMGCIHPTRIQEAVLLALLSLLNHTDTARFFPVTHIAKFFVPFTSVVANNFSPRTMFDTYPTYMSCAKTCLTMMFRSWSGLFYFLHDGLPCLQTLMYTLAVSSEMRNQILDLLFGLFPDLPKPHPSTKDIDPAILGLSEALANCAPTTLPVVQVNLPCSADGHSMSTRFRSGSRVDRTHGPSVLVRRRSPPTAWDIQGGFVAAEGLRVFPRPVSVSPGLDLMDSYSALLLATLIQAGLYEGLIGAISDSNQVISVRAGLLLGLLAYRASTLLPHNHPAAQRLHHCGLLRSGSGVNQLSVVWLERVHRVMRAHDLRHARPASLVLAPIHSPFLECLARQSRTTPTQSNILDDVLPSADNANLSETWLDQIISQSGVLPASVPKLSFLSTRGVHNVMNNEPPKPPDRWDWELLASFGRLLGHSRSMLSWERKTRIRFLHRLMDFFTPTFTGDSKSTDRLVATSGRSSSIPNTFPAKKSHVKEPVGANKNVNHNTGAFTTSTALFQPKDQVGSLTRGPRSLTALSATYGTTESLVSSPFPSTDVSSTSTNLASLPFTWPHSSAAGVLIAGLIPHLALYPQNSEPGKLLSRFLSATQETFERSLPPVTDSATADTDFSSSWDADQTALFSSTQLAESCSGLIILALGRLTSSDAGESRLEGSELCAIFHRVLLPTGSDVRTGRKTSLVHAKGEILSRHCKILLSSLDFTRPGRLGHQLLTAAVNGATKPVRMYSVQLIRLLFRLQLPFLSSWCVDLVVKLCLDPSKQVASHALQVLEEICSDSVNVHALARSILPEPSRTPSHSDPETDPITPFAFRLLDPRSGTIGYRIFSQILTQSGPFRRLSGTSVAHSGLNTPGERVDESVVSSPQPSPFVTPDCPHPITAPVHWVLEVTKQYFNVAYALEVDSRLWSLFTGPIGNSTGKSWNQWTMGTNQNGTHQLYSMPLFACFARHFARTSSPMDADSDAEPDMVSDTYLQNPPGLHCNQRDVFHFDETVGVSDSVTPSGVYLPPALVSNHSGTWTGEAVGNYWSCPLPRHPYGCLAEHTAGMELMLERGDLDTLIHTLQAAEFYWTTPPLTSAPNLRSTGPNSAPSAKTTRPSIMEVKGALWALAHVGSATCGQAWMAKQPSLISLYIQIATEGRCMGLRAVAWLCLNLLVSKPGGGHLISQLSNAGSTTSNIVPPSQSSEFSSVLPSVVWLSTYPDQPPTAVMNSVPTEPDPRAPLDSEGQLMNSMLVANPEDFRKVSTAFSVHSVPVAGEKTAVSMVFENPSAAPSKTRVASHNTNGSIKAALANGLGLWKPFGCVTLSLSRTRRWLPRRRCSPRHYKHGSSPSTGAPSVDHVQKDSLVHQSDKSNGRSYARHASIDSSRHLGQMIVREPAPIMEGCRIDQISPTYSSPERSESLVLARSSATWTHRDQWIHRDTLLRFSEPGNMAFPLGPIACPESDDSDSRDSFAHSTSLRRAICLPADVQILGQLADGKLYSITGTDNVVLEMPTGADMATADANSDPLLAVAHQLSFVHIAAAAQQTLHKCEATDLSNSQSENSTNSASMYAPGNGAEVSVNSSKSKCVKKGEKSCSVHSNSQLMNNSCSSEVYVPPSRVIRSSANPHTDEIQLNGCQLRSRPHPTKLMNLDSVSVPFDHYCLSPKCKQHSFRSEPDRSRWFSQLMDVITGLLANVLSVNHELALNQLVEAARTAQRIEDSTLPELPELEESHPSRTGRLFDACVYTEVANLLQDYSFSLEARSKIQSAFLNLDLYGLFPDTNQAVSTLERYVADFEPVSVVFNNN